MLSHNGAYGNSRCLVNLLPESEIGVFSCVNGFVTPSRPEATPEALNMYIVDLLLGKIHAQ